MPAGLPGAALLQLHQEAEGDPHPVLHPQHGGPRPLLGLVRLSQVWQGGERGLQRGWKFCVRNMYKSDVMTFFRYRTRVGS